jgi:hypothetical protein
MEKKSREEVRTQLAQNPERHAKITVSLEVLRFLDVNDLAFQLRQKAVTLGIEAIVRVTRGLVYHTIELRLTGKAESLSTMLDIIDRIENIRDTA